MPLITISHSIGSDGMAIAVRVPKKLNYDLYDGNKLQKQIHAELLKNNLEIDFLNKERLPKLFAASEVMQKRERF